MIEDILEQAKRKADRLLVGSSPSPSSSPDSGTGSRSPSPSRSPDSSINDPVRNITSNTFTSQTNAKNPTNQSINNQPITGSDDVVFTFESFENNMKKGDPLVKKFSLSEKNTSDG